MKDTRALTDVKGACREEIAKSFEHSSFQSVGFRLVKFPGRLPFRSRAVLFSSRFLPLPCPLSRLFVNPEKCQNSTDTASPSRIRAVLDKSPRVIV
jgi:hypothetical protein